MNELRELRITRVGAQGDGVADDGGAAIFVPFTLTGERVAVDVSGERARLLEVLEPSEERVKPVCRHFGVCGGCSVQHMAPDSYRAWKRECRRCSFRTARPRCRGRAVDRPGGNAVAQFLQLSERKADLSSAFTRPRRTLLFQSKNVRCWTRTSSLRYPRSPMLLAPLISKRGEARLTVLLTNAGLDVRIDGTARQLTSEFAPALLPEQVRWGSRALRSATMSCARR